MPYVDLGPKYPVTYSQKPPQLPTNDYPVWDSYRKEHINEYKYFYYNVPLTLAELPNYNLSPKMQRQVYYSYSKRIDVVGIRKDKNIEIIEVTAVSSIRAIGQVLTYTYIWNKLKPLEGKVIPMILSNHADYDTQLVCKKYNICLIQLHPIKSMRGTIT